MSTYPEHDKLSAISDKSQAIGEFLEWMSGQGIQRMRWREDLTDRILCPNISDVHSRCSPTICDGDGLLTITVEDWVPDGRSIQTLLAEFFEIDQDKIEAEKRAMLDGLREANATT